jgi:peptidoglycan/LPS O-acetylase OafA/YrhL
LHPVLATVIPVFYLGYFLGALRLFLAVSVLSAHSGPLLGYVLIDPLGAVKLFYAISGFYMALVLSTKYAAPGSLKDFYINRALRLYPAYFLVLCCTVFCMIHFHRPELLDQISLLRPSQQVMVVFSNLFFFGQDWMYFFHTNAKGYFRWPPVLDYWQSAARFDLVGIAWTLGLECTFYLLAPLLVRMQTCWLLLLTAALVFLRSWCASAGLDSGPWVYRFFPFELPFFLAGMLAYRLYVHMCAIRDVRHVYIAALPLVAAILWNTNYCGLIHPLPVLIACLPVLFLMTRTSYIDALIGAFSYPVYITHLLIKDNAEFLWPQIWHTPLGFGGGMLMAALAFSIPLILIEEYLSAKLKRREPSPARVI